MTGAEYAVLLGALLTGLAGLITAIATGKTAATKAQVDSLTATITTLQAENARQNERIEHLQDELDERDGSLAQVKAWAALLIQQVVSLGGTPCQMPEKEKTQPRKR